MTTVNLYRGLTLGGRMSSILDTFQPCHHLLLELLKKKSL